MKQVLRKGLKEVVVDEVPDPVPSPHHVLVRPVCSLISAGTETASIHTEGLLRGVAENPSHIKKILDAVKVAGPVRVASEVSAKLKEYGALGYAGAGVLVDKHPSVTDLDVGARVAYGGEGTGHAETVAAGRLLVARIPDEVSFEEACFTTLGAIAMHSVRLSGVGVGDVVAVVGLGMIGQLVAQIARAQGAVVIGLDLRADRRGSGACRDPALEVKITNDRAAGAHCDWCAGLCVIDVEIARDWIGGFTTGGNEQNRKGNCKELFHATTPVS